MACLARSVAVVVMDAVLGGCGASGWDAACEAMQHSGWGRSNC